VFPSDTILDFYHHAVAKVNARWFGVLFS